MGLLIYFVFTVTIIPIASLCWIVITSPSPTGLLSRASLLSVTSKEADPSQPSLWLGMFSSCARQYDNHTIKCKNNFGDPLNFNLRYDLSVLPQGSPDYILQNPPPFFRGMALFSGALVGLLFFLLLFMCSLPCYILRRTRKLEKYLSQIKLFISMGLFILGGTGLINFLVLRQFFKQTSDHFNVISRNHGPNRDLVASLGNCFRYAFSCYVTAIGLAFAILLDRAFSELYDEPLRPPSISSSQENTIVPESSSSQEDLLYLITKWPQVSSSNLPGPSSTQDLLEMLERRQATYAENPEEDDFSLLVRDAFEHVDPNSAIESITWKAASKEASKVEVHPVGTRDRNEG